MNNLTHIQEVFAGLYNIYIVKATDILSFGDIIAGELQSITLKSGADYTKIPFTRDNAGVKSALKINKVAHYNNQIELFLSGNDLEQIQDISQMDGNTFILLFEDRQNRTWVAGTPKNPLRFTDKYTTGDNPADANGRKIVFESSSILPIMLIELSE